MSASYTKAYYDKWAPYQRSWDKLLTEDVDARDWSLPAHAPDVSVATWLRFGQECLFASDKVRAPVFLWRAIRNADRLEAENRFHDTVVADVAFPGTLGRVLRDRAYARWLLGEPLDRRELHRAAENMIAWCLTQAEDCKRFVSDVTMDRYLQGVRAAMISGDWTYAEGLANTPQKFRWHHALEMQLWRRFLACRGTFDRDFRADFEGFFDRVRDPDFMEVVDGNQTYITREGLRLDSGILRHMYLVNQSLDDVVDPQAVIEAIAH